VSKPFHTLRLSEATDEAAVLPSPSERCGRPLRITVEAGGVLDLTPPRLLPEEGFSLPRRITPEVPSLALARLEGAVFDGGSGMVFPSPDTVLFDPLTMWPLRLNGVVLGSERATAGDTDRDWRVEPRAAAALRGAHAVLGLIRSDYLANWHHWLIEYLPRFFLLSRFADLAGLPVVMAPPATEAQRQSLEVLGLDKSRLVTLPPDASMVRPEAAYVPGPIGVHSAVSPRPVAWLAETVVERLGLRDMAENRLLYVRRGGYRRAVANEGDLGAALAAMGFRIIVPAEMAFADQVRTYRAARVIVSAHGAGLANTVFCRPGTVVVELTSLAHGERPSLNMMCANLSAIRGLIHVFAVGRALDAAGNFTIDPAKVVRAVMLGLRAAAAGAETSTPR